MIFLAVLFLVIGFFAGSIWTENQILKSDTKPNKQAANADNPTPTVQPNAQNEPSQEVLSKMPQISDQDHKRGAKNPKIYLVEYSDYECPYCEKFHLVMEQIIAEYGDQVSWVYRHYPLAFHPNARPAAQTAECVADLAGDDAFWSFSDAVFAQNKKLGGKLSPEAIDEAVKASGADMAAVKDCAGSSKAADIVTAQMEGGAAAGINGTPGTMLLTADGEYQLITGALPYDQIKQAVEKYL
ncbi:thioredoxin domain-containing protein [Patescibacteria group bacterium]|nr:thioredoxin domain-containing protein [Patescibacteria group bacterium]